MDITVGMNFTGKYFKGNVHVESIDEANNKINVELSKEGSGIWYETWDLQHTKWGFDRGDYFL